MKSDPIEGEYLSKRDPISRNQKVVNPTKKQKAIDRTAQQFVKGEWRVWDHSLSAGSKAACMNGYGETPEEVKVRLELEKQERARAVIKSRVSPMAAFKALGI